MASRQSTTGAKRRAPGLPYATSFVTSILLRFRATRESKYHSSSGVILNTFQGADGLYPRYETASSIRARSASRCALPRICKPRFPPLGPGKGSGLYIATETRGSWRIFVTCLLLFS